MSLLITTSLVGSIRWRKKCYPSQVEKADEDLKNQLGRIWVERPGTDPRAKGVKFEDTVYAEVRSQAHPDKGSEHFRWFVKECTGGVFQKVVSIDSMVGNRAVCFYGKIDVWFPTILKDLKTTTNWRGPEKYLESYQHKVYCWAEQVQKFRYIIGVFSEDSTKLLAHYAVDYEAPDYETLTHEVMEGAQETLDFLKERPELWELYVNKFCKKATEEEKRMPSKFSIPSDAPDGGVRESQQERMGLAAPTAMPSHLAGQKEEVEEDSLKKLDELSTQFLEYDSEIERLEAQLKEKKERFRVLSQVTIPQLIHEHGLSEIKLKNGAKIEVKEKLSASVPEEKEAAFFEFLKDQGAEDLIKLQISFGRMLPSSQKALFAFINSLELEHDIKKGVHPQTLGKYLRDLLGFGLDEDERKEGIASGKVLRVADIEDKVNAFVFYDTTVKYPK